MATSTRAVIPVPQDAESGAGAGSQCHRQDRQVDGGIGLSVLRQELAGGAGCSVKPPQGCVARSVVGAQRWRFP